MQDKPAGDPLDRAALSPIVSKSSGAMKAPTSSSDAVLAGCGAWTGWIARASCRRRLRGA
eukprot:2369464-Pyramimonas_sp.AAC.1